ncbi:MAG: hypothetical protein H6611_09725 [Ignavibacteriales bacterium]|nr:hypothetical protein [Ignavibacteriales bacterium]
MKKLDTIKYSKLYQDVFISLRYKEIQNLPEIKKLNNEIDKLEIQLKSTNEKLLKIIPKIYKQGAQNGFTIEEIDHKYEVIKKKILCDIDNIKKNIKLKTREKEIIIDSHDKKKFNRNTFKEFYPIFYTEFEKEFENLFKRWVNVSDNKNLMKLKTEIKSLFEQQVLNNLYAQPYLINNLETKGKNVYSNLVLHLVNQPIRFFELFLSSVSEEKNEVEKTVQRFIEEINLTESNYRQVNNELSIAQNKIKKLLEQKRAQNVKEVTIVTLEKLIPNIKNIIIRTSEECRMKNTKLNYSKIGKKLGVSHHTAKKWCAKYNVKIHQPYLK